MRPPILQEKYLICEDDNEQGVGWADIGINENILKELPTLCPRHLMIGLITERSQSAIPKRC